MYIFSMYMPTSGITQQTYARRGTFKYRFATPIRPCWDQPVWNLIFNKLPVGPQGAKGTMFKGKRVNICLQQDSVTSGFVSRDCSSERDAQAGQHEKQSLSIHFFHLIVFGSYPLPLEQFQLALKGHPCEEYTGSHTATSLSVFNGSWRGTRSKQKPQESSDSYSNYFPAHFLPFASLPLPSV